MSLIPFIIHPSSTTTITTTTPSSPPPSPPTSPSPSPSETSTTGKGTVKRKYHDSYLDIGFAETSDNKPQCVICGKVLPNS